MWQYTVQQNGIAYKDDQVFQEVRGAGYEHGVAGLPAERDVVTHI